MMCHLAHSVARALAAGILPISTALASLSIGVPLAHAQDTIDAPQDTPAPPGRANAPTQQDHAKQPAFDPIDERLKYLHDRLRITPAQEPLWANIARVMRENAKAVAPLARERLQPTKKRTAIDTLDIYEKLGEVQLQGLKDFLAAFQPLYDSLSDDQKKIADVIFRTGPLSMIGSIPELPEQLVELPPAGSYALGAYPPAAGALPYPSNEYYTPYPAYPYYPYYLPWTPGPFIGLGSSFFLFPRHSYHYHEYHHHVFVPPHPSVRAGLPRTWAAPRMQSFRAR